MGGVKAQDYETYYSQDYEGDGVSVDWTTSVNKRFTPYLQTTGNNTYLTVQQGERANNGCILQNTSLLLEAGKNFTMLFDIKLGASNDKTKNPVVFYIKDASGNELFSLKNATPGTTKWIVNDDANLTLDLAGTGTNSATTVEAGIESSSYIWYTFQLTENEGDLFLTITNTATKAVVLERTAIKSLSEKGGLSGMQFDTNRYNANLALDNILVRSVVKSDVPDVKLYTVTTKYQLEDGTTVLEDNAVSVEEGKAYTPDYKTTFDDDNYRYTYKSGADEISSVGNDATITIVYTREALPEWSVAANTIGDIEKTLSIIMVKDAKNVSFIYPRYIEENGKLYQIKKGRYDQGYVNELVSVTANSELSEQYNKCASNIAFFAEAEDIPTLTSVESGNVPVRCSGGKAAYAQEDAVITKLSAGAYKLKAAVFGNVGQTFTFKAGDKTIFTPETKGYFIETESETFNVDGNTDLVLSAGGNAGGSPKVVDYVVVEKTADIVNVSDLTYASYVPSCNVIAPDNVKVYTAKANEGRTSVSLHELPAGTVIPAGTAVLVGAPADTYTFAASADETSVITDNDLQAATAETKGDGATTYALTKKDGKPVFAIVAEGVNIPEGKAYLKLEKVTGAKLYSIDNGEVTGISEIKDTTNDSSAYYTLQGLKTNKATKGIYIHNGKKVVVK